jgi:FMN phosphatase YigB (HAD superfamily)
VGDSLSLDILGAHQVGMKTAWVNRKNEQTDIVHDSELSSLENLLQIAWVEACAPSFLFLQNKLSVKG